MKTAFTIIRVSREDQLKGYGPDVQWFDDVLSNAPTLGLEVSEELRRVIQEPATGWDREIFQGAVREALHHYQNGEVTVLLFPRVDRETRFLFGSFPLLCEVIRTGMEVYFARDRFRLDPSDIDSVQKYMTKALQAQVYAAEWRETSMAAKRKRATVDHMMPTGRSKWAHDYHSYRKNSGRKLDANSGKYTVNEVRAAWVKRWADWILEHGMSIRKVQKCMNNEHDIQINRSTITDILGDPILIGRVYAYRTKVVIDASDKRRRVDVPENEWLLVYKDSGLRILSDEQFYALKEQFRRNKENACRNAKNWYPPLRGIVFCVCGRRMVGITLGGKEYGQPYYRCLICGRYERAIPLWDKIQIGLKQRLLDPKRLVPGIKAQLETGKSLGRLEEECTNLQRRKEGWTQSRVKARRLHLLPNSKYTLEEYLTDVRAMDERIQGIDSELARVRQQMAGLRQAIVDGDGIARFCEKATRNLGTFDDRQWRILLERMRLTVLVDDTGITVKMAVPTVEEDTSVIVAGTCRSDDR